MQFANFWQPCRVKFAATKRSGRRAQKFPKSCFRINFLSIFRVAGKRTMSKMMSANGDTTNVDHDVDDDDFIVDIDSLQVRTNFTTTLIL
jgi:hypothetical protein